MRSTPSGWLTAVGVLLLAPTFADERSASQQVAVRDAWTTSQISGTPDLPPPYTVEPAFPALTFSRPLDLCAAPGSNRLFVAEQGGTIQSFVNRTDVASMDLVVDLKQSHPELTALYALTFHPQFAENRQVYLCYIKGGNKPDGTFVSEFKMTDSDPPTLDPTTERVLIRWWSGGHNGCSLKFGPDNYLYISTGDGGAPAPPDPLLAGQDVSNLLSCILRIDVDAAADNSAAYQVPKDNPFVEMPDVRPEIWAYGFRNPWRMSFDSASGDLWVGDVGWQLWEMIYRVERGANYGWPIMEGPQPALPEAKRGPTPIVPPIVSHPHSEAASITGGYVYHGKRLPDLEGVYIYGDFQSGIVWGLQHDGIQLTRHDVLARTGVQLVSFGEDHQSELYLVDYQRSQQIYQLVPNPRASVKPDFPNLLSQTGLFQSMAEQTPATGVASYQINAAHWADHTTSERWMAVPGTDPVRLENNERWQFPEGSVLAKTVSLEMHRGDPSSTRRLETQILHQEEGSWRPYTYAWNAQQTDAELVPAAGFTRTLQIQDAEAPDGIREQQYRFAARSECQMCHNPWVERKTTILGFQSASPLAVTVAQLNLELTEDSSNTNQLTLLQSNGWISGSVPEDLSAAPRLADPLNAELDLNQRARTYLHVNCAHCHQPHAGGSATIELTHDVPLKDAQLLNVRPAQGTFGISSASLIAPGDPTGSVLHYRMAKLGSGRMPRAGSEEVDAQGVALIRSWITSLPADSTPSETSRDTVATLNSDDVQALTGPDAELRTATVQRLTASTRGALELLQWLLDSSVDASIHQQIVNQAAQHSQFEVRDLFERFIPVSQRAARLGTTVDMSELLAMEADPTRGHAVFFREGSSACTSCHRIKDQGKNLGPDLTLIGKKYVPREMLTHLLEPSQRVDPQYVTYVLETKAGRIHSGLLTERTEEAVALRDAQDKQIRVAMEDVETLLPQQKSLMPDLLLRDLTPQQVADLVAFLCALK